MKKYAVQYTDILNLDECGLINSSSLISLSMTISTEQQVIFNTDDFLVFEKTKEGTAKLIIQQYPLSEAGKGLYKIIDKDLSKDYFLDVVRSMKEKIKQLSFQCIP